MIQAFGSEGGGVYVPNGLMKVVWAHSRGRFGEEVVGAVVVASCEELVSVGARRCMFVTLLGGCMRAQGSDLQGWPFKRMAVEYEDRSRRSSRWTWRCASAGTGSR